MSGCELPFHKLHLDPSHSKDFSPPDRFISRRRFSDVDASHFKLLMKNSPIGGSSSSPESPATPEERAYGRRMARMSSGRTEGGVLSSSAGVCRGDVFNSPCKERPLPKSPDHALQMTDIADDLYTSIMSWSSKNEVALALNKSVYVWNSITGRHRRVNWKGSKGGGGIIGSRRRRRSRRRWSSTDMPGNERSESPSGDVTEAAEGEAAEVEAVEADKVVCSVAWHHNGRLLALGLEDGTVRVWDSLEPHHVPQIENREIACCFQNAANAICWGPHHTIFSGHHCGCILEVTLHKNDAPTHDTLLETAFSVSNIAVSDHKRYLAVSTVSEVLIWQLTDRVLYRRLPVHSHDIVKGLLFVPWAPDLLARGTCREAPGRHSSITIWHVMSETVVADVGIEAQVCSLAANKNTRELVSGHGGVENAICVWSSELELVGKMPGHNCRVLHLAVSPDGTKLASCSPDQVLKIWSCFEQSALRGGPEGGDRKRVLSSVPASPLDPLMTTTGGILRRATVRRASMPAIHSPLLGKGLR